MGFQLILMVAFSTFIIGFANAAQISEADLLALTNQEVNNDSERLFEYVKTTSEGIRLGCKGKVQKGSTGKVQALFIEDSGGRREFRKLGPITAKVKNFLNQEEDKYVALRDFPMYCLERVFHSSSCPPGPTGRPGRDGRNGTIGNPGHQGYPGKNGIPGKDGYPGPQGPDGKQGAPGQRGDSGDNGPRGEPGPAGGEGVRGRDGNDGIAGAAGGPGESGSAGEAGKDGVDGIDGVDGGTGEAGVDGVYGLPGPNGLPGLSGFAGNNGFNGVDGIDGQSGVDGRQGLNGECCNSDDSDETCPVDFGLENVAFPETEESSGSASEVSVGSGANEDESVKTEMKPVHQKPASFWMSNTDLFSINHSSVEFKNKNKNRKGQGKPVASTGPVAPPHNLEKIVEPVQAIKVEEEKKPAAVKAEKNDKENEVSSH